MKTCSVCGIEKSLDSFHKRTASKDGLQNKCKPCAIKETRRCEKARGYEITQEEIRRSNLKRVHGISIEEYERVLEEQDGCCAICDRPASDFTKRLAQDHDHTYGYNRGLLCMTCNLRLGALESPIWRKKAEMYLQEWEF